MKKLTQKEKAIRYDELLNQFKDLIERMESVRDDINTVDNRNDVLDMKENSTNMYWPYLCGILKAKGSAIDINLISSKYLLEKYTK